MRAHKTLITVLAFAFGLFFTYNGHSQNLLQKEPSTEIRKLAKDRSEMWTKKLALSAKQQDLVEKKIIEFTMKRIEIQNSRLSKEEKINQLLALESMERGDIRDILTKPQYDRYVFLEEQDAKNQHPNNPKKNSKNKERQ